MVEDVSDQRHVVEVQFLGQAETLEKCHIMNMQAGPFQHVDAAVAEPRRWRIHKARSIEPSFDGTLPWHEMSIADPIRKPAICIRVSTLCVGDGRGDTLTGLIVCTLELSIY